MAAKQRFVGLVLAGALLGSTAWATELDLVPNPGGNLEPSADRLGWPRLLGAQYTGIQQHLEPMSAAYSGPLSLRTDGDNERSHTFGLYFGMPLGWGLQAYMDIELFKGAGISGATGLGGLTNGDVVRQGSGGLRKTPYIARKFLRYLVPLTDERETAERGMDQLPAAEPSTRLEFKAGTMAVVDDFDRNRYANSTRTQFMNWGLFNNTAWDFAADTRGYTNGGVAGFVSPRWSVKLGVYQMPSRANAQDLDAPLSKARGENLEFTVKPHPSGTVVRLLAFRNRAHMGDYREALAQAAATGGAPDVRATGRDGRTKYGFGINVEQPLADGGETGLFLRAGWNDGATESFAFTEVDRHFSLGLQMAGGRWGRADDRLGAALLVHGLSGPHRDYLAAGGTGFVLGDGQLNYGPEQILEAYYRVQLGKHAQISPDIQHIRHPGYNRDRGPATVVGLRVHLEY